jgi:hypothetical protein
MLPLYSERLSDLAAQAYQLSDRLRVVSQPSRPLALQATVAIIDGRRASGIEFGDRVAGPSRGRASMSVIDPKRT